MPDRRMVEVLACAVCMATAACGGASQAGTRASPTAAVTQVREAGAAIGEVRIALVSDSDGLVAGPEPDGRARVIAGGTRALVRVADATEPRVELAADVAARPLVGVADVANGWLFTTADGLVLRAPTFLGPLERVGETPGRDVSSSVSHGRLAIVGEGGAAWTASGDGHVEPLGLDPALRVRAAAFQTQDRGVAVDDVGDLHETSDGGQTWSRVVGAVGVSLVSADDAGAVATMLGGSRRRLLPSFELGPPAADDDARGLPDTVQAYVNRAQPHTSPTTTAQLPNGHTLSIDSHGLLRVTGESRGRRAEIGVDLNEPALARARGRCALASREHDVLVACPGALFTTPDAHRFDRLELPTGLGDAVVSRNGQWAGWVGTRCGDGNAGPFACVVDVEHGVASSVEDVLLRRAAAMGIANGQMLAQCGGAEESVPCVVTPRGVSPLARALDGNRESARTPTLTPDGTLLTLLVSQGQPLLLRITPDGRRQTLVAPRGARSTAFMDDARGIAAGAELGSLYRTIDGGRHWQRFPIGRLRTNDPARVPGDAWCSRDECGVGGTIRITSPFAASLAGSRVFAREGTGRDGRSSDAIALLERFNYALECERPSSARRGRDDDDDDDDEQSLPRSVWPDGGRSVVHVAGGWARIVALDARRTRLEWLTSTGLRGSVTVPAESLGPPETRQYARMVLAVAPTGVLLRRAVGEGEIVWRPSRGSETSIPLARVGGDPRRDRIAAQPIAAPLSGGRTAFVVDSGAGSALLVLGPSGGPATVRPFRSSAIAGLVERAGVLSLLRHPRAPASSRTILGEEPDEDEDGDESTEGRTTTLTARLAPADANADPGTWSAQMSGRLPAICGTAHADERVLVWEGSALGELEVHDGALCVRAVWKRGEHLTANNGRLRGNRGSVCRFE